MKATARGSMCSRLGQAMLVGMEPVEAIGVNVDHVKARVSAGRHASQRPVALIGPVVARATYTAPLGERGLVLGTRKPRQGAQVHTNHWPPRRWALQAACICALGSSRRWVPHSPATAWTICPPRHQHAVRVLVRKPPSTPCP